MFTLDFEEKKVFKKVGLLAIIFVVVNVSLFYYLNKKVVAFKPLLTKAEVLSGKYPTNRIIIGGDSIAQTGINPLQLTMGEAINVAYPGTGIRGFSKVVKKYFSKQLNSDSILIVNLSALNSNDRPIEDEKYINLIDSFLDTSFWFLIKSWKMDFFKNLFSVYQCHFSVCPYYEEKFISENIPIPERGFVPLKSENKSMAEMDEKFVLRYEAFYKNYVGDGAIFESNLKSINELIQTGATVIVVFLPIMDSVKNSSYFATLAASIKNAMIKTKAFCEKYPNCKFLNYASWDNQQLGPNPNQYFYDYVHLNGQGAAIFNKFLNQDIIKIIGNTTHGPAK